MAKEASKSSVRFATVAFLCAAAVANMLRKLVDSFVEFRQLARSDAKPETTVCEKLLAVTPESLVNPISSRVHSTENPTVSEEERERRRCMVAITDEIWSLLVIDELEATIELFKADSWASVNSSALSKPPSVTEDLAVTTVAAAKLGTAVGSGVGGGDDG